MASEHLEYSAEVIQTTAMVLCQVALDTSICLMNKCKCNGAF